MRVRQASQSLVSLQYRRFDLCGGRRACRVLGTVAEASHHDGGGLRAPWVRKVVLQWINLSPLTECAGRRPGALMLITMRPATRSEPSVSPCRGPVEGIEWVP